jgi:hypothetical protein
LKLGSKPPEAAAIGFVRLVSAFWKFEDANRTLFVPFDRLSMSSV